MKVYDASLSAHNERVVHEASEGFRYGLSHIVAHHGNYTVFFHGGAINGAGGADGRIFNNDGTAVRDIPDYTTPQDDVIPHSYVKGEIEARIVDPRQKAIAIEGTSRDDQYVGSRFNDTLNGGAGADTLTGAEGDDTFYVGHESDQVIESAGQGHDMVIASSSYRLSLSAEVEILQLGSVNRQSAYTLEGSDFGNTIIGHAGRNTLRGHDGDDKLHGGLDNDQLVGGRGKDEFVFDTKANQRTNVDKIGDFRSKDDSFYLDNAIFAKLGSGSASRPKKFKNDMFVEGKTAQDREDRIVYDRKTGALYYDQDGTGGSAQVKIATISNKTKLYYHDFFVI